MTRVLVPVAVLEGGSVSPGLISLLGAVDVTVLGYHVLPEQTPPDQARLQFGERATSALEDISQEFAAAGGAADHRLVFTHDREQTIERVTDEVDADAFAAPGTTGDVDRVLVSLSGDVDADRILSFVDALVGDRDIGVTLFLAAGAGMPGDGAADAAAFESPAPGGGGDAGDGADVRLAAAADRLRERGLDVDTATAAEGSPFRSFVFGEESERVAAASVGPVLVVRDRRADDESDEDAAASPADDTAPAADE